MVKACKWCKKEQEMTGKREFCPGEHCKNAYKYAKRTGKFETGEKGKGVNSEPSQPPLIEKPAGMNEIAATYWDKIAPTVIQRCHLNVLSVDSFAELCDIYSRLTDINTMINLGMTHICDKCGQESHIHGNRSLLQVDDKWDNKGGTETQSFKESALSDLKRKYSKLFLDYQKQFYLTPQSNRGNFGLPEEKPKEDKKAGTERFF